MAESTLVTTLAGNVYISSVLCKLRKVRFSIVSFIIRSLYYVKCNKLFIFNNDSEYLNRVSEL